MKATGIVRRIDYLGRIVIPKEIRRAMGIKEGDELEIFTSEDGITFNKFHAGSNIEKAIQDVLHEMMDCAKSDEERKAYQNSIDMIKNLKKEIQY